MRRVQDPFLGMWIMVWFMPLNMSLTFWIFVQWQRHIKHPWELRRNYSERNKPQGKDLGFGRGKHKEKKLEDSGSNSSNLDQPNRRILDIDRGRGSMRGIGQGVKFEDTFYICGTKGHITFKCMGLLKGGWT